MPNHSFSGRLPLRLDNYKASIINRLTVQHQTQKEIVTWLQNKKSFQVDVRTLQRYLKKWDVNQKDRTEDSEQLRNRIIFMFCKLGASDNDMLLWLQKEGFKITRRGLVRIRRDLGLKRLEPSQELRDHMDEKLKELLEQELPKNVIQSYGKGQLVEHFQKLGHPVIRYISYDLLSFLFTNIIRDRLFALYCTLAPDAVNRRYRDVQRKKGECVIPGPNLVWSVDGHDKLAPFGIEIYAGIDGHARYITWLYIGISNRTAVSVLRGYLDTITALEQQPRFVRSDRGVETGMMAHAHLLLQQVYDPDLKIQDCYMFGTSTANTRIESWWPQLGKSCTGKWVQYFRTLRGTGRFSQDKFADRIAILAIYFPTIRTEVTHFVDNWNTHAIRKQPHRPKSIQGKPYNLFYHPKEGIKNYGLSLHTPTVQRLQNDVKDWGKYFDLLRTRLFSYEI